MKLVLKLLLAGVFILLVILVRVWVESHGELQKGSRLFEEGELRQAIVHFDRAARWYAPFNPYSNQAMQKLWVIGKAQEKADSTLALLAYDSVRGSAYAVRSFYSPYAEWLEKVNPRIAHLRSRQQVELNPKLAWDETLRFHTEKLAEDRRPRTFWTLIVLLGFFGWVGGMIGWIWKGFDREGKMYWRSSFPWLLGVVTCFSLWIVGLLKA